MRLGIDVYMKLTTFNDLTTAIFNPKHTNASSICIATLMGWKLLPCTETWAKPKRVNA